MKKIVIDSETIPRQGIMDTWFPGWAQQKGHEEEDAWHFAALYPEFGRTCCVVLTEYDSRTDMPLQSKTFAQVLARNTDEAEKDLLEAMEAAAYNLSAGQDISLIGHNLKGFDIPFLAKRFMALGLQIPDFLRVAGKKPWEITHQDTMELLKFGSFSPMSLRSAALMLGIEDPKENVSGAQVADLYEAGELDKIEAYCRGDVSTTYQIYQKLEQSGALNG